MLCYRPTTTLRRGVGCAALVLGLTVLNGCSHDDPAVVAARASSLTVATAAEIGGYLVDGQGNALYVFEPDDASEVTCTFTCSTNWPPLLATEDEQPQAGDGVDASLIATLPNPSGGKVITYNGWPLYRYRADRAPGEHRGQNIDLNGGDWYVMTPQGNPLIP